VTSISLLVSLVTTNANCGLELNLMKNQILQRQNYFDFCHRYKIRFFAPNNQTYLVQVF